MPSPRLCPICGHPDLPFGGESVCDCPDPIYDQSDEDHDDFEEDE